MALPLHRLIVAVIYFQHACCTSVQSHKVLIEHRDPHQAVPLDEWLSSISERESKHIPEFIESLVPVLSALAFR